MPKRRQSSDGFGGAFAGLPWWVRSIGVIGIPGFGLGFVLYWMTESFDRQLTSHQETTIALDKSIDALSEELRRAHEADAKSSRDALDAAWRQFSVVQRICVSLAKTDNDRLNCVTVSGQSQAGQ